MKELIERSYKAIIERGLIKDDTHIYEFMDKIEEEFYETKEACDKLYTFNTIGDKSKYIGELIDLATVCFMQVKHLGYDPIKEFEKVVIKNEKRAEKTFGCRKK